MPLLKPRSNFSIFGPALHDGSVIVKALAELENDLELILGNHHYTIRRAKAKGASGFIVRTNEKLK